MKASINQVTEFHIYEKARSLLILPKILFWLSFPMLCLSFLANLIQIINLKSQAGDAFPDFIATCFGIVLALMLPFELSNQYDSIRTTKEGMYVLVHAFRDYWKFIPWKDVSEIKLSPLLDRWKKPVWVIKVKRLTYWHMLLSQYYRAGSGPGIILTSDLENRDVLLEIIDKKLSQQARRVKNAG